MPILRAFPARLAVIALASLTLAACSTGEERSLNGGQSPFTPAPVAAATQPAADVGSPTPDRYGGVLRVAQADDPLSCDLHMSRGMAYQTVHACAPMLSQLVRFAEDDHGLIFPDLAQTWSLGDDGVTWAFGLRDDARWHDGTPVTADDLKFSLDRIIDPPPGLTVGRAAPVAAYVTDAEHVQAADTHTVIIKTDHPAASFLPNMASVYVSAYPEHATQALDPPTMVQFRDVIGSGPFKMESSERGSAHRMVRNDDYYEAGLPYLDGLWYVVIPEPAIRLAALRVGEVDMVMVITEDEAVTLERAGDRVNVLRSPSAGGNTVQMNFHQPPFDDPRVRRAVNLAIDRDDARLALGGGFDGAIMPPGGPWALDPQEVAALPGHTDKEAERAEARHLLQDAGFPEGLDITLHTRANPFFTLLGAFAIEQLKTVGIRAEMVAMEAVAYQDLLARGGHGVIVHSHAFALDDPDSILPSNYACDGAENFPGLCDAELDRLIRVQSSEMDPDARKALVDEIQRRVWEADAKVWFNWSVRRAAVSSRVQGFIEGGPSMYQGRRMDNVWVEER